MTDCEYWIEKYKMMERATLPIPKNSRNHCHLCGYPPNEEVFGRMFVSKNPSIAAHRHCVFFCSHLTQRSISKFPEWDGFCEKELYSQLGFYQTRICNHCGEIGGTMICHVKSCQNFYHFPCAISAGCEVLFFGNFRATCPLHRPEVKPSVEKFIQTYVDCLICMDSVHFQFPKSYIQPQCCKTVYFHRSCIQKQALHTGYLFRCPACNNQKIFTKQIEKEGLYIPLRDASWELDNSGRFAEIQPVNPACEAVECLCSDGKRKLDAHGPWRGVRCNRCEYAVMHQKCCVVQFKLRAKQKVTFRCLGCTPISTKVCTARKTIVNPKRKAIDMNFSNMNNSKDDDDEIIIVDPEPLSPKLHSNMKPKTFPKSVLCPRFIIESDFFPSFMKLNEEDVMHHCNSDTKPELAQQTSLVSSIIDQNDYNKNESSMDSDDFSKNAITSRRDVLHDSSSDEKVLIVKSSNSINHSEPIESLDLKLCAKEIADYFKNRTRHEVKEYFYVASGGRRYIMFE